MEKSALFRGRGGGNLDRYHVKPHPKSLDSDGLIVRSKRSVTVSDWKALAAAGDFQSTYLHLPDHKLGLVQ